METQLDEIAGAIFWLSTFVPDIGPTGFTFNQFLVQAEEPLLFHTGPRAMFPSVSAAISRVLPVDSLRWITFGHVEADECGAMNLFLAAAPAAQVAHGALGRMVSPDDLAHPTPSPWAANGTATSTHLTSRTDGRPASFSRRPRAPCSAVTCSPISETGPH